MRKRLGAWLLLGAACRGLLAGAAVAVPLLLLSRFAAPFPHLDVWAWSLPAAGALLAAVARRRGPAVALGDAALFLDRRWKSGERVATAATCPADEFSERAAAEIPAAPLPRLPLPREGAFVPAALFLLVALSLLPRASADGREEGGPAERTAAAAPTARGRPGRAPRPAVLPEEARRRLAAGERPAPADETPLREAIEARLKLPEERREAHALLDRALRGEAASAKALATALLRGEGASAGGSPEEAEGPGEGRREPAAAEPGRRAAGMAPAYPEMESFLRDYRNAVAEGREGR